MKFTSKFNDFYKKIQNNNELSRKVSYFIHNYWFVLVLILLLVIFIQIKVKFNSSFHTNKIEKFIENSTYAGNAVVINKQNFLTTYDVAYNSCIPKNKNQDIALFVITSDGKYYGVDVIRYSRELNLAVLKIVGAYENSSSIRNYVIFPKKYESLLEKKVYISKTKNTNESYFYKKNKIKGISSSGYFVKQNNFRNNKGESVLNTNLEFVGLSGNNSTENKFKFLLNEVNIINQNKIENFLTKNRIIYKRNVNNINLFEVNNYLKTINVKVVCHLRENRMPIIIRTNQVF